LLINRRHAEEDIERGIKSSARASSNPGITITVPPAISVGSVTS
jgi:hypothetical protein